MSSIQPNGPTANVVQEEILYVEGASLSFRAPREGRVVLEQGRVATDAQGELSLRPARCFRLLGYTATDTVANTNDRCEARDLETKEIALLVITPPPNLQKFGTGTFTVTAYSKA